MKFTKYHQFGDYHWREHKQGTIYGKHADFVKEWVKERPVLDVGCGDGLITHLLGGYGIDNEPKAIELAKLHKVNCELKGIDQVDREFLKDYKAIYLGDTIEHLEHWDEDLVSIGVSMPDHCILYITTPPAKEEIQDPFHYFEWTPEEFKQNLEDLGFKLIEPIFVKNCRMYGKFKL